MDFSVSRRDHPLGVVLSVHGELDVATVPQLRAAVAELLEEQVPRLYVDLSDTAFVDSTGCTELARAARRGTSAGTAVELVVPVANWRVRRVVDFMQFGALLPVHDEAPYA